MLAYKEEIKTINENDISLIIAPSNLYLSLFKDTNITLCTQDIPLNEELSLTGDNTIKQLKSLGVTYAIIGHHERREYYQETEHDILIKIRKASQNNIKVIYCIGESLEEMKRRVEYQVLEKLIARVFNRLTKEEQKNIIIAYEPTYLIGKNTTYDLLKIRSMILFIKRLIKDYYNLNIPVVFGGSIKIDNIADLKDLNIMDGFIICTSILDPKNITEILNKMTDK